MRSYLHIYPLLCASCLQCFDTVGWAAARKGIRPVKMGDGGGGHWLVRMDWRPAGWWVCLRLLIFPCTIKSRSSLLAPAHPGGPGKRAVKRLWCMLLSVSKNIGTPLLILKSERAMLFKRQQGLFVSLWWVLSL